MNKNREIIVSQKKINIMYSIDVFLLLFFMILMWTIFLIVKMNIIGLFEGVFMKCFLCLICFLVLIFGTISIFSVIVHLKQNKIRIYTEDCFNKRLRYKYLSNEDVNEK